MRLGVSATPQPVIARQPGFGNGEGGARQNLALISRWPPHDHLDAALIARRWFQLCPARLEFVACHSGLHLVSPSVQSFHDEGTIRQKLNLVLYSLFVATQPAWRKSRTIVRIAALARAQRAEDKKYRYRSKFFHDCRTQTLGTPRRPRQQPLPRHHELRSLHLESRQLRHHGPGAGAGHQLLRYR